MTDRELVAKPGRGVFFFTPHIGDSRPILLTCQKCRTYPVQRDNVAHAYNEDAKINYLERTQLNIIITRFYFGGFLMESGSVGNND